MTQAPDAVNALALTVHDERIAEGFAVVDDGIGEYNAAAAPLDDARHLAVYARDGEAVVGGAVGRTWGECAELQLLWLPQRLRRLGVGARLVGRFEAAAVERGCRRCYLDTFTFQAPAFYERLGYRTVLTIPGYAPGIVKHTMLKELA
jgi:GNAT superfamily N-acetyltransferase